MTWPNGLLYGATYDPDTARITSTPALINVTQRAGRPRFGSVGLHLTPCPNVGRY